MRSNLRIAFTVLLAGSAWAQPYVISTIAGGVPPATPAPAINASIGGPWGVAVDANSNVYFSSRLHCVFKLDQGGVLTRLAGTCRAGFSGDGGPATSAQLNNPQGLAVDAGGNVYIADSDNNRIRKVSTDGNITTIAGNTLGFSGDGSPAAGALLSRPLGVASDADGNLFIADTGNNRIRKISTDGVISTVAGDGTADYYGDGSSAASAALNSPSSVAVDSSGNLYIGDYLNLRVRKIAGNGVITTVAGTGVSGSSGDGGPAASAQLAYPFGVAIDPAGNLYIGDVVNDVVRLVSAKGIISTVAGGGRNGLRDGGLATSASLKLAGGVAVSPSGDLYIADNGNNRIRKVSPDGMIATVAGNGEFSYSGDAGPSSSAQLWTPSGVAVDQAGNLYIADTYSNRIRKVSGNGIISTVAGNGVAGYSGDGGPAVNAQLAVPRGIAVDAAGNLYIADRNNMRVRKVSTSGVITTVAGNGVPGNSGDGGPAPAAQLNNPAGLAVDGAGNLYIADLANHRIRKVSPDGTISTFAGNGDRGYSGDNGPASAAQLSSPAGVAADASGNVYIADSGNALIRKVALNGNITTVAGNGTQGNFDSSDGGAATDARLGEPAAITVDSVGNLFIVDLAYPRITKVSTQGVITSVAGDGTSGYSGDGGSAAAAEFSFPNGVAINGNGNLFVSDSSNNAVRLLQLVVSAL